MANPIIPGERPVDGPATGDPTETGFCPRPRLRWLSVRLLIQTAREVVLSRLFGNFVDRRELQAIEKIDPTTLDIIDLSQHGDLRIDYVADAGDGFNAAVTIASIVARVEPFEVLDPSGQGVHEKIPPAELLVLGGDEAYPSGSTESYQDRLVGPYRSMLGWAAEPRRVVAVPGNHDWYDGLVSFIRVFCQQRWIGAWKTQQKRSYFAVRLPHGWWLWGIDIQFESDIDEPQLKYFRQVAERVGAGEAIILCSAKPSWVKAGPDHPEGFALLEFFERTVVPGHACLRISLSGDSHQYARYQQSETNEQRITAGGGGAYLSATHHLPPHVDLPPAQSRDPKKRPPTRFTRAEVYPAPRQSWLLGLGVLWRIFGNRAFYLVTAVVYLVLALQLSAARQALRDGADGRLPLAPLLTAALVLIAVTAALHAFAADRRHRQVRRRLATAGHLVLHLGLVLGVVSIAGHRSEWVPTAYGEIVCAVLVATAVGVVIVPLVGLKLADPYSRKWGRTLIAAWVIGAFAILIGAAWWVTAATEQFAAVSDQAFLGLVAFITGAGIGTFAVGVYLLVASSLLDVNTNELFSAQAIEDYKSFLSMQVTEEAVVIHPIAVDRVPRPWRFVGGKPCGPWFAPAGDQRVVARLIEEPIRVTREPGPAVAEDRVLLARQRVPGPV
ncbi:MAG: hypothetical protein ACRDRH_27020 [Pseudonocardia sp.]